MAAASDDSRAPENVVVIGAGPAGLTAAYALGRRGGHCIVVEADTVVGGISRTAEREGWRFDIGGHRFFTKVREVEELWHEILGPEDFLLRPRLSRIYHDGKFFDYPIQLGNALKGLGLVESFKCGVSYVWVRIKRPKNTDTFEGWVASRFGWRLYNKFFKTYTEKVWGVPATEIQADWAAQRIKNLSLWKAVLNAVTPHKNTNVTSLNTAFESPGGVCSELPVDHVVSSMPLAELALILDPPAPEDVQQAAKGLHFRDFLTVALVVPKDRGFPDNWIYVHDKVKLGRIQNFGSWSPEMVKDGRTCLGLEYFVFEGDELWTMEDQDLVALGKRELSAIGLVREEDVEMGFVVRMPKAYPVYDEGYATRVETIRRFLADEVPNLHPVGRNGMHRYNNQDHSMLTALLTVENLFGEDYDTWSVNVEADYHEEQVGRKGEAQRVGTGRSAPVAPTKA